MRAAAEIVETVAREVEASFVTTDDLERRIRDFGLVSVRAPAESTERVVAGAIATRLRSVHTRLTVTRFTL